MTEIAKTTIYAILGLAFIAGTWWYLQYRHSLASYESGVGCDIGDDNQQNPTPLPTQAEIQQVLVNRGYDIEIDGVIGMKSRAAWDTEICNQHAKKYFGKSENYLDSQ